MVDPGGQAVSRRRSPAAPAKATGSAG
jgi:hypothetical protein